MAIGRSTAAGCGRILMAAASGPIAPSPQRPVPGQSAVEEAAGRSQAASGGRWAAAVAAITLSATLIPYLAGAANSGPRRFMWLGYNLDDACVYLSWMRQAAGFHALGYDLFTTAPQRADLLNPLFLALGVAGGALHIPLLLLFHTSRLIFGGILLWVCWRLVRLLAAGELEQKLAFLMVCSAAGLGWLPVWWNLPPIQAPIDTWQPEAITFLSLYLSPLFCFALALQALAILLLYRAYEDGSLRLAAYAGLCGLGLGLVHTYDVVSVGAVWLLYLGWSTAAALRTAGADQRIAAARGWAQALLAAVITAPGVATIALELHNTTVFRERAAVATLSPSPIWVLRGYGLSLVLALVAIGAAVAAASRRGSADRPGQQPAVAQPFSSPASLRLLVSWLVANFAVSYLPTSFQRKLLQGEHFPVAILAGVGAAWLLSQPGARLRPKWRLPAGMLAAALLCVTNVRFLLRDVSNFEADRAQTKQQRPYMESGENQALEWITRHVPAGEAVQPLPWLALVQTPAGRMQIAPYDMTLACFTPGMTGHPVYCGHWGETPDYGAKLQDLTNVLLARTTDSDRLALLRRMRVSYLVFSQKHDQTGSANTLEPEFRGLAPLPSYLRPVYGNEDADVYRIIFPAWPRR